MDHFWTGLPGDDPQLYFQDDALQANPPSRTEAFHKHLPHATKNGAKVGRSIPHIARCFQGKFNINQPE